MLNRGDFVENSLLHIRSGCNGVILSEIPLRIYLLSGFIVCDIRAYTEGPLDVNVILVQLQQEYDQHE